MRKGPCVLLSTLHQFLMSEYAMPVIGGFFFLVFVTVVSRGVYFNSGWGPLAKEFKARQKPRVPHVNKKAVITLNKTTFKGGRMMATDRGLYVSWFMMPALLLPWSAMSDIEHSTRSRFGLIVDDYRVLINARFGQVELYLPSDEFVTFAIDHGHLRLQKTGA